MHDDQNKEIVSVKTIDDFKREEYFSEHDFEKYASELSDASASSAFEQFKAHRRALLGKHLPLMAKDFLEEAEREKIERSLDLVKSLGFFSAGYIDNLIIYFEALKSPFLSADYLIQIIDKYIRPDIRVQGARPFQKFAVGYFCNELKKYGASNRSVTAMMVKHFLFSQKEIDNAVSSYKSVAEYIERDEAAYFMADLIGLIMLYETEFCVEDYMDIFTEHHNSQGAKEKFLAAYDQFSQRIDQTYIPHIQKDFENPPYFLDKIILPELKEYILSFKADECARHEINILAGVILSVAMISLAPNLIDDQEKLIGLGWLNE